MILFTKTTPDKAAAVVAKIEARLSEARRELERARDHYGVASLAFEEGAPNSSATKDKALKELQKTQIQITEAEATLSAAKVRHAEALKSHSEEQEEEKWVQVEAIAIQRDKLAEQIQSDVKRIAQNYETLV